MEIKKILLQSIPFVVGLIIGIAVTKGWKLLGWILMAYFIGTIILNLISDATKKIKESTNKQDSVKDIMNTVSNNVLDKTIDMTATGISKGKSIYDDRFIKYAIPLTLTLLLSIFLYSLMKAFWTDSIIILAIMVGFMILRDIRRSNYGYNG